MSLKDVSKFISRVSDTSFEIELCEFKKIIRKDYFEDIVKIKKAIALAIDNNQEVIIVQDSDFDGYSSARDFYYLVTNLGVREDKVEIIYLNSLHKFNSRMRFENSLLLISDTGYSNLEFNCCGSSTVIWVDHHEIGFMDYLKAKSLVNHKGVFINITKHSDKKIQGLSCGAFIYILLTVLIEELGLNQKNEKYLLTEFDNMTRQESLMSLISDRMDTEKYVGLLKGIYDARRTLFYDELRNDFDFNNKKYFKKHIARINNLIRMDRTDLLEKILKEDVTNDMLMEIVRIEQDKRMLINRYFKPSSPTTKIDKKDFKVELYDIPLSKNKVMRNFKGLMASMKIPEDETFVIFSYYEEDGKLYMSCRNNVREDIQKILKDKLNVINIGGHAPAFGLVIPSNEYNKLVDIFKNLELTRNNNNSNIIKYINLKDNYNSLCNIALYNEFNSEEIKVHFEKSDFQNICEEPKRTLYEIYLDNKKYLGVVSFDVGVIKDNVIGKPRLKKSLYDLDNIEIGEF